MSAPTPNAGPNPWGLTYQNSQFGTDTEPAATTPSFTVFGHLANPPGAGVNASTSPDKVFLENTNPPIGASGHEVTDSPGS